MVVSSTFGSLFGMISVELSCPCVRKWWEEINLSPAAYLARQEEKLRKFEAKDLSQKPGEADFAFTARRCAHFVAIERLRMHITDLRETSERRVN